MIRPWLAFGLLATSTLMTAAACGGASTFTDGTDNGEGGSAGTGRGGSSATGGTSGTGSGGGGTSQGGAATGGVGTGGVGASGATGGTAGAAGCGPCLRVACAPPVNLNITANPNGGSGVIAGLTAVSPDLGLNCFANGSSPCQWYCSSTEYQLSDGDYNITISAPGYASQVVSFSVMNPTNCGCCGCSCGVWIQQAVVLEPTGDPIAGCCAIDQSTCAAQ